MFAEFKPQLIIYYYRLKHTRVSDKLTDKGFEPTTSTHLDEVNGNRTRTLYPSIGQPHQ